MNHFKKIMVYVWNLSRIRMAPLLIFPIAILYYNILNDAHLGNDTFRYGVQDELCYEVRTLIHPPCPPSGTESARSQLYGGRTCSS